MKILWLFRPLCWLRGFWRTVKLGVPVSGHDSRETEDSSWSCQTIICEDCGIKSVGYRGRD